MYLVYVSYIAVLSSIGLLTLMFPYMEGKTPKKKILGLLFFSILYTVQDVYMNIVFQTVSVKSNALNCIAYYLVQWFIIFFFFKSSSIIKFVMVFGVDFLMMSLCRLIGLTLVGVTSRFDFRYINQMSHVPNLKNVVIIAATIYISVLVLIPIVHKIMQKRNVLVYIIAGFCTLADICSTEVNHSNSLIIVFPFFTILVVAGLIYQSRQISRARKLEYYYKQIEENQEMKEEELHRMKQDILAHIKQKESAKDNVYAQELLNTIEEKLKDL